MSEGQASHHVKRVRAWPWEKSMRRVLRYDGLLPVKMSQTGKFEEITPKDIQAMKAFVDEHRSLTTPFDIVVEGETPGDDPGKAAAIVRPLAEAGATWWIEALWSTTDLDAVRTRVQQGPPHLG